MGESDMTKKEFAMLAAGIRSYYPKENILPNEEAMELWFRQLEDISFKTASTALSKWVSLNRWSPAISDLREMASEIEQGELPDWGEAWENVIKAIARCGSYDEEGALGSMDELTRISVQRLGWLTLCMSEDISIERANFRMIYEAEAKRKKREQQIPPRVRQITAGFELKGIEEGTA
jgi:hypothetical protein